MKHAYKQLEEAIRQRPTVALPVIRRVDKELLRVVRQRIKQKELTWTEAFTEMAIEWLKKK